MFIDGRSLPDGHIIEADLCIIGGGAAGIALAREFHARNTKVALIESGDHELNYDTQSLYHGTNIGPIDYPGIDTLRLRYFGGTTNHWAGNSALEDASTFEGFDWIPYSQWPIGLEDIQPYLPRAFEIVQLGHGTWEWSVDFWKDKLGVSGAFPFDGEVFETIINQRTPKQPEYSSVPGLAGRSMGVFYRNELAQSENIDVYLNLNAVEIETNESAKFVKGIRLATLTGVSSEVRARAYVLATGGIENARLLLASNKVRPAGLGNDHDLVGRFFADHIRVMSAGRWVLSPKAKAMKGLINSNEVKYSNLQYRQVRIRPAFREREKITSATLYVNAAVPEQYIEASHSEGVESIRSIFDSVKALEIPDDLAGHIANIVADFDDVALTAYRLLREPPPDEVKITINLDPIPNRDSRVQLGEERDPLGLPRILMNWQMSELDWHSMYKTMEQLAIEIGKRDLGRLKIVMPKEPDWETNTRLDAHHVGTTRMALDPSQGVVDKDCRLHGCGNLFIAGSSVFPTTMSTTPTMFIVALALRLAKHIETEVLAA